MENSPHGTDFDLPEAQSETVATELGQTLAAIDAVFIANRHEPRQRYGAYLCSLAEIANSLRSMPGFGDARLVTLEDLANRLAAMASGQKQALLPLAKEKGGRPEYSALEWSLVGRSAAVTELLMRRGFTEPEACKRVADVLHAYGIKGRRGLITAKTIEEWRAGAPTAMREQSQADFTFYLQMFESLLPKDLTKTQLASKLRTLLRPFAASADSR